MHRTSSQTREAAPSPVASNNRSWLFRLGYRCAAHPWRVLVVWIAVAVSVAAGASAVGDAFDDTMTVPGVDSDRAMELLTDAGSHAAGVTAQVVVAPANPSITFTDSGAAAGLRLTESMLATLANVESVSTTIAPDRSAAIVVVQYRTLDQLSKDDLDRLNDRLDEVRSESARSVSPLEIEAGGELFWNYSEPGSSTGELIGLVAAMVILLVAFGSLLAMGLPIATAIFGLVVGISVVTLASHIVTTPSASPQLGLMIGLGVGIDYALFMVTRFREFDHSSRADAISAAAAAVATAGKAVLFAGGTVVIAILGLAVTGVAFITAMGIATSIIVAFTVAASLTLLPALLGLVGRHVDRFSLHRRPKIRGMVGSPRWHRWGEHVSRHAWPYAVATTIGLVVMTAPVLDLQLGFPDDGVLAESRTERRAYDLVAESFGPGANGPLLIAIDTADTTPGSARQLGVGAVEAAIAADPGIAAVMPPRFNDDANVATMIAIPTTAPRDPATNSTIDRLRRDVVPAVTGGRVSNGSVAGSVDVYIGGTTATFDDIADRVTQRLPWFIVTVVGLSFVLLMVAFRSILVPLKAAILNLLSIGAAYGVMVMVFQWGWGTSLIGLETTVPIMSFIPLFMFALLFGLSMDYEVFLLTRVREFYDATDDNERSVIDAIAVTARVITSAALIMISVFGGFVFGSDPSVKMMGLGMATAIFVDATIVRLVLVPATMKLMGRANWWLPDWLARRLPDVHLD